MNDLFKALPVVGIDMASGPDRTVFHTLKPRNTREAPILARVTHEANFSYDAAQIGQLPSLSHERAKEAARRVRLQIEAMETAMFITQGGIPNEWVCTSRHDDAVLTFQGRGWRFLWPPFPT